MSAPTERRQVDPVVWKACAGTSVQIPPVDSRVYYFPQGHFEQCSPSPPSLTPLFAHPFILCRVVQVLFLADSDTDEVYAKIQLIPINRNDDVALQKKRCRSYDDGEDTVVESFTKILTPSDANNGGGFSVPRFCADSIFPPLNFAADPPVQTISIRDVHGRVWDFRHIYRGTPRRHLLTTGWSKFVNSKKLVAGDSVVFMRNQMSGGLFLGVRRAVRSNGGYHGRWNFAADEEGGGAGGGGWGDGFSRSGEGDFAADSVAEAAELASRGEPFEVVYRPGVGFADFVVKADKVEGSLSVVWSAGMRVKMALDTEDSSRVTWFQGTVSAVIPDNGSWRGSPWRMLQVTWDDSEALQNMSNVSPWQVEYVTAMPQLQSTFPLGKKLRIPQSPRLPNDKDDGVFFPIAGLGNSMIDNFNASFANYNTFPAGMQGARQDPLCVSGLSNLISENTHQVGSDGSFSNNFIPKMKTVSTELNIISLQSENLSPNSQSSVGFCGNEISGKNGCTSVKKAGWRSMRLFGELIHVKDYDDNGHYEDNHRTLEKTEGLKYPVDLSLTCPCAEPLEELDVQCQKDEDVDASVL